MKTRSLLPLFVALATSCSVATYAQSSGSGGSGGSGAGSSGSTAGSAGSGSSSATSSPTAAGTTNSTTSSGNASTGTPAPGAADGNNPAGAADASGRTTGATAGNRASTTANPQATAPAAASTARTGSDALGSPDRDASVPAGQVANPGADVRSTTESPNAQVRGTTESSNATVRGTASDPRTSLTQPDRNAAATAGTPAMGPVNANTNATLNAPLAGQGGAAIADPGSTSGFAASSSATVAYLRAAEQPQRTAALDRIEAQLNQNRGTVSQLPRNPANLSAMQQVDYAAALQEMQAREAQVQESLRRAQEADESDWAAARNRLADDYDSYLDATMRARSLVSSPTTAPAE